VSERTLSDKHQELIRELGPKLVRSEQVAPPPGLSTGWISLDRYLLWHGFPKSALTLMVSEAGGATTLWSQSAAKVTQSGQWVAWINDRDSILTPWSLRWRGVDLSRLLWVSQPSSDKQILWALQELMSLGLFEMIGCDLGDIRLKEHQVLKLKKLALRYGVAVVLLTRARGILKSPFYALILHFEKDFVHIGRALHRPTPHTLERRDLYADTLPLLATGHQPLCG
jgi:hypothetical protein